MGSDFLDMAQLFFICSMISFLLFLGSVKDSKKYELDLHAKVRMYSMLLMSIICLIEALIELIRYFL